MPNYPKILASLALTGALMASAPAAARDARAMVHRTFRDLEYGYSGSERLDVARTLLSQEIPAGTDISTAREAVRRAGAHCGAAIAGGQTRCTFATFDGVDDHLHDVVWTVRLDSRNGRIVGLDVARDSIGS